MNGIQADEQQRRGTTCAPACVRMPVPAMTVQAPPERRARALRSGDSSDRESGSWLANRAREDVFERRQARAQVPHLHAGLAAPISQIRR